MTKIELSQMSIEQKLQTMELLWDDLCHETTSMTSPQWHGELLQHRFIESLLNPGKFINWSDTKRVIAKKINEN